MLGWHFLIQCLCSLLMSDVLMLGETSKIVLPQGFNCSLPCGVRYTPWFIIIQTDSLPLCTAPQTSTSALRRSAVDQRSWETTWSELCPARQLPAAASSPQGLAGLSLLCTVTRMSDCPHACQRQPGQGRAAVLP